MITSYTKLQCTGYKRFRDKALECLSHINRPQLRPYCRYSMQNIRLNKFRIVPLKTPYKFVLILLSGLNIKPACKIVDLSG